MWIISPSRGFYSVVEKESGSGILDVRARCKRDIDNLGDLIPGRDPIRTPQADYLWRVQVPGPEWEKAVATMASEITYSNVKSATREQAGPEREAIYARVWQALLDLEAPQQRHARSVRCRGAWGRRS